VERQSFHRDHVAGSAGADAGLFVLHVEHHVADREQRFEELAEGVEHENGVVEDAEVVGEAGGAHRREAECADGENKNPDEQSETGSCGERSDKREDGDE
jgi:hypothetical protein